MAAPYSLAPSCANGVSSASVAFLAVVATVAGFSFASNRLVHWFIIPISICGILMGADAVDWFRGRLDLYDPQGLIGILGFHFFFIAPLLHVLWDFYMHEVSPPPDWRDWLGYMGVLNVIGILCYRLGRRVFEGRTVPAEKVWEINKSRFRMFLPV